MGEIREEAAHHLQKVGRWRFKWAFGSHSTRWFWHRTPGHNWVLRIPGVWISGVRLPAALTPGDTHQFRPIEDGDGECAICHMGTGNAAHTSPGDTE